MSKPDEQNPKPWQPKPRFLAPRARPGDGHGYVNLPGLAMPNEPECLDEADFERYIAPRASQDAAKRLLLEQQARERDARLLSQEERIVKAQREAAVARRDVSREVWLLRSMQAKGRQVEVIEKRVQGLERIAYLGRAA